MKLAIPKHGPDEYVVLCNGSYHVIYARCDELVFRNHTVEELEGGKGMWAVSGKNNDCIRDHACLQVYLRWNGIIDFIHSESISNTMPIASSIGLYQQLWNRTAKKLENECPRGAELALMLRNSLVLGGLAINVTAMGEYFSLARLLEHHAARRTFWTMQHKVDQSIARKRSKQGK